MAALSSMPNEGQQPHSSNQASAGQTLSDHAQPADWLTVPQDRVIVVEHPCIVKNVDNGLKSIGGENHIKNLLLPAGQTLSVGLSLRPHDPIAKKLVSREVPVQNLLLRVTVPKRTGRKRKRGSNDPFNFAHDRETPLEDQAVDEPVAAPLEAAQLLQRMRDNDGNYSVQPIGQIKQAHRFRALPDFQVKTGSQTVMKEIGQHLTDPSLVSIKRFNMDTRPGVKPHEEILPPPSFTSFEQSMNYTYRQNPGVSHVTDAQGQIKTVNLQKPKKRAVLAVAADIDKIPDGPPPDLPSLESTNAYLRQAVHNISKLLDTRPVVTRRVAMNLVEWGSESLFKEATQYVGYSFRSGPWRDALVRYGVDPRKDPKYRIYQTLSFQLMSKDKLLAEAKKMPDGKNTWIRTERYKKDHQPSHVFDGKGITTNGKTWQMYDIQEPLIKGLLDNAEVRSECDVDGWGWYQNGTMSKVRIIMRDMIGMMLLGQQPDLESYKTLAGMPDIIDPNTYSGCYFEKDKHGDKAVALSGEIRNLAKSELVMKAKTRKLAEEGAQVGSPRGIQGEGGQSGRRVSGVGGMDGATDDPDEDAEGEVEGDDLNASDADEGAEEEGEE